MTQTTFDTTLTDATETDLFSETADTTRRIESIHVHTDNDSGSDNGFHTTNSSSDTLTLRLYRKMPDDSNFLQVDNNVVDQGQGNRAIVIQDNSINHADFKVSAQLSSFSSNVRITGTIEEDQVNEAQNDFDNTADPVELLGTGGSAGKNATELVDDIFDEDVVANHNTADTAGNLLQILGANIQSRSNNANLNALLGVADSAGSDLEGNIRGADNDDLKNISDEIAGLNDPSSTSIRDEILDRDVVANHNNADSVGLLIEVLGAKIEDRANNASLHDMLGIPDVANSTLTNVAETGSVDDSSVTPSTTEFGSDVSQNDGFYDNMLIKFTSGANAGQVRDITAYASTDGKFTLGQALDSAPSNGDDFEVIEFSSTIARG